MRPTTSQPGSTSIGILTFAGSSEEEHPTVSEKSDINNKIRFIDLMSF